MIIIIYNGIDGKGCEGSIEGWQSSLWQVVMYG